METEDPKQVTLSKFGSEMVEQFKQLKEEHFAEAIKGISTWKQSDLSKAAEDTAAAVINDAFNLFSPKSVSCIRPAIKVSLEYRRIVRNKKHRSEAVNVLLALSSANAEENEENFERRQESELVEAVVELVLAYREQIIRTSEHGYRKSFHTLAKAFVDNFFDYVRKLPSENEIFNDETEYANKEFFLKGMVDGSSKSKKIKFKENGKSVIWKTDEVIKKPGIVVVAASGQYKFYKTKNSEEKTFGFRSIFPYEREADYSSNKLDVENASNDYADITVESIRKKSLAAAIRKQSEGGASRNDNIEKDTSDKRPILKRHNGLVEGYVERDSLQNEIMDHLKKKVDKSRKYPFNIVNIHGIGGHGKSQLATKIFEMADDEKLFDGNLYWMDAEHEGTLLNQFKDLLRGNIKSDVITMFYSDLQDKEFLLIFDNVKEFDEIAKYLPRNSNLNAKVLLTSKTKLKIPGVENVSVSVFNEDEADTYIKQLDSNIAPADLDRLQNETSCIPADLCLLCHSYRACKEAQSSYSWDKHLDAYASMLSTEEEPTGCIPEVEDLEYKTSTRNNVEFSVKLMESKNNGPLALLILKYLAFCSPTNIERGDFVHDFPTFQEFVKPSLGIEDVILKIDLAVTLLESFGFVRIYYSNYLTIHRSYQSAMRALIQPNDRKVILKKLIDHFSAIFFYKEQLYELWRHVRDDSDFVTTITGTRKFIESLCAFGNKNDIEIFKKLAGNRFIELLFEERDILSEEYDDENYIFPIRYAALYQNIPTLVILVETVEDKLKELELQSEQNKTDIEHIREQMFELVFFSVDRDSVLDVLSNNFSFKYPKDLDWFHDLFFQFYGIFNDKTVYARTPSFLKIFRAILNGPDDMNASQLKSSVVNRKDAKGVTLLEIAVKFHSHDIIEFLVESGAIIEAGHIYAAIFKLYEDLKWTINMLEDESYLLTYFGKIDLSTQNPSAVEKMNWRTESFAKTIAFFVEHSDPLLCKDTDSNAKKLGVLYLALTPQKFFDMKVIEFLLKIGADPNILLDVELEIVSGTDDTKYFPPALHSAMRHHPPNLGLVELLLDYQADASIRDIDGSTPLDLLNNWKRSEAFNRSFKDDYKKIKELLENNIGSPSSSRTQVCKQS